MFAQMFFAIIAGLLLYIGIEEGSIFNIIIGTLLLIVSANKIYQAKTGSSFQEKFEQCRKKNVTDKNV